MFEYNPAGLFLGVLPTLLILYYILIYKGKSFIYYHYIILLSFAFVGGTISLITAIPYDFVRSFVELLIWVQFFYVLMTKRVLKIPGFYILIYFLLSIFVSSFIAGFSFVSSLLFLRRYLFLPIAFFSILNTNIERTESRLLIRLILLLSVSQVFVSMQKLITIGQQEDYIGSLTIFGGSLTTIFSLIGVGFSYSYYLQKKNIYSLFLIFGFIFFAVVGEKRGFIVYLPVLILFIEYQHSRYVLKSINFSLVKIIFSFFVFVSLFYVYVRLQPSLNPDAVIGGDFDIDYILDFGSRFTNSDAIEYGGNDSFSRGLVFFQLANLINNNLYDFNPWFGFGPGDLIMSRFSEFYGIYLSEEELMLNKYGIGYGGRSGLIFTFLQIGLMGVLGYLFFIRSIYLRWVRLLKINPSNEFYYLYLGLCSSVVVFILDFFTYSRSFQDKISIFLPIFLIAKILEINSHKTSVS